MQCHKYSDVDGPGIILYAVDDTLYLLDFLEGQVWGDVDGKRNLSVGAILFRGRSVWVVLLFQRHLLLVLEEKHLYITRHGNVKGAGIVIPIQLDATVEVACPIFSGFIFLFDAPNEMVHVLFTDILNTKIVHH
jgi:hypothetical protein